MPSTEGLHRCTRSQRQAAGCIFFLACSLLLLTVTGCSPLGNRLETLATTAHLQQRWIEGGPFKLLALERTDTSADIDIYIEGDGRPWSGGGTRISSDPTPRKPSALELMSADPLGQLYLGRPCYFGTADSPSCESRLWTFDRYGETVVAAMTDALQKWSATHSNGRITLIGYSGGGVLALLIAERLPAIQRVIAIATPVDHERWTKLHDYTALYGSINPAELVNWRPHVERIFIFGADDDNVPPAVFAPLAARIKDARIIVLPDEGHDCCQKETWQRALQGLP